MKLLITGLSGHLGQAVVKRLIRRNPFDQVFGIDRKPPQLLGPVRYIEGDIRHTDLGDLVVTNGIEHILHLAYSGRGGFGSLSDEVKVAEQLLDAAEAGVLKRLVFASRDWVYAPSDEPVNESAELRLSDPRVAAKVQVAKRCEAFMVACGDVCNVVRIRTCPILGPAHKSSLDQFFRLPVVLGSKGDPLIQILHIDDAAEIFIQAIRREKLCGIYNVAAAEPLPLSEVAGVLQKKMIRLPGPLRVIAAYVLSWFSPATVRPWILSEIHESVPLCTDRWAEQGGYRPMYSTRQTLAVWRTGYIGTVARKGARRIRKGTLR